jgi:hypothetical protein
MANPNRTVAAAKNRKSVMVRQEPFDAHHDAEAAAEVARAKGETVRVTSYKIGPRNKPITKFMVRWYEIA